jgi:L-ascorbate metabolism protein UlaG (beta-lactamase superfamily)
MPRKSWLVNAPNYPTGAGEGTLEEAFDIRGGDAMKITISVCCCLLFGALGSIPAHATVTDVIATSAGDLEISFIGHGTLMISFDGHIIHIDPFSRVGDYSKLPDADLVLITHAHGDHLDPEALAAIRTPETRLIAAPVCADKLADAELIRNGETTTALGIKIEAVPAYNLVHMRSEGQPFHPKGEGNGYVLTFGDTRVYVAGDTENTPEMKGLEEIDVAFLPMNLPYTMTPEMVADAARAFKPRILYPYHYGATEPEKLVELLADEEEIEVRVRALQ